MINRVVHNKIDQADDLEIHVSTITTLYGVYVEVREYIPSLKQYGRGITFPSETTQFIQAGLESAGKS